MAQFLVECNLAFKGTIERVGEPSNGNFLDQLELLAKFDTIMGEYLQPVTNARIHYHNFGKKIHNALITVVAEAFVNAIL